ncbi:PREDICTED: uncharacterized protein LOC104798370 isoform X2 [Tarenaya hassleriana]|uniref:uncharacterized protein LOC104798370 isoform X2 n=1 Tax=Tarenaya hassleriana TaxID=28532 RepID=UPI00053C0869|nr:PREDICTED: uncharacterized protein LOC104798370 isoform X2 [Tarenaya hassleriana]
MDYDDIEFQSQNLHLAGETNNKYPPVLQPYALPKFDFDDSLNGNLRFDSFVETEVFLGTEGNEANNWIEEFSQRNSGVVFSSSASESCAISRHNNVWSEATSTESVEMLLKSVGQDEIMAREDTVNKSDICNVLGCIEQMEPSETCGEKGLSIVEAVNLQPNPSFDETPGESSVSLEDVGLEQPLVKDALPNVAHELSMEGSGSIQASGTGTGEVAVTLSSQNGPGDAEKMFAEQDKMVSETTECLLDKREHEVSSDSRMENDRRDGSVQNSITSISELNTQKTSHLENFNEKNNISVSMQSSSYTPEDLNRDGKSVSVDSPINSHVISSSKRENVEAKNVGNMAKPDLMPSELSDFPVSERSQSPAVLEAGGLDVLGSFNDSEAQCQYIPVSGSHASRTIEISVDLSGKVMSGENIPAEEKPELLSHKNLETVANECESSFWTERPTHSHQVETSEAVRTSPVDMMDESGKTVRVDGVSCKSADSEGSFEQRTDLDSNVCDVDCDDRSPQIVSERTAFESLDNTSGASAFKLTKSKSQSDTIPATIVDEQKCQALSLNVNVSKHLNNDERPAASVASLAGLPIPETSSDVTEKGYVSESEKVSSCEPENGQTLSPAAVCGSGNQKDKQACMHDEDVQVGSTNNVDNCSDNDGSMKVEAQDTARETILQKSAKTILEEYLDAESKSTKFNPNKDSINAQPNGSSLANLGAEVKKDSQEDKNNTESMDNMNAGTPILRTEDIAGDTIKIADSSCISTFSGPGAEYCDAGREKAVTDPGDPSTSSIGNKPFMPSGSQVGKTAYASCGQSLTCDTSPLADSSMKQVGEVLQAINSSGAILVSPIVDGSPVPSSLERTTARTSKGTPRRKPKGTSKSTGKDASRKGNAVTETTPSRQLQCGKASVFNQCSPCTGQISQSTENQQNPHAETPAVKPSGNFSMPSSSLPNLNSSALSSLLRRPFTDMQQVQLRAQIFVYGALIQGTTPDEAHMISAFGGPDGGKGIWEKLWRACFERAQTSHAPETPLQSRSDPGSPAVLPKTVLSGKIATPSVGYTSSKDVPSVNPIIPPSSPLWTLPTPCDTLQPSSMQRSLANDHQPFLSSLHAHRIPPVKNIVGHSAPWILPTPYHSPWLTSPQTSAFDVGSRFSVFPITKTVKLTPMEETSLSHSGAKHLQKDPNVQSVTSRCVVKGTPFFVPKSVVVAPSQHSTEVKARKRKNIPVSEEPGSSILSSHKQTESVVSPLVTFTASAPFTLTSGNLVSNATAPTNLVSIGRTTMNLASTFSLEKLSSSLSSPILSGNLVSGNLGMEQKSALSEDAIGKLKEAMRHAEDASTLAAAAVSHSQYEWKQVDQQKNTGLEPENQGNIASAVVAIAAAAAVAKAAAAAANVAASAALQAKLMSEEAAISNSSDQGIDISKLEVGKTLDQATPASISMGSGASVSSNLVLTAAREAAKKRVEAATAATKQAENMDAIVKAAELAAEAVSQAGKLVSLGDPLLLNELVEVGPGDYWRHTQVSQELEPCQRGALKKKATLALQTHTGAGTRLGDPVKSPDTVSCLVSASGNKRKGLKYHKARELANSVVPEPEVAPMSSVDTQTKSKRIIETANGNDIKEGSSVEVYKEGPGLRTGWYSANVLSLKDGEAYVCYNELSSEGANKLKEWVALEGDGDVAPKLRMARSITVMPFEGTRKRRRSSTGDRAWSVGDKVDAWVHDSWWEGVISEKNKKDQTTLTVHFPVQRETLAVKSWNLLPSLVWKDGRWIECSGSEANISSLREGDTPNEKRPRVRSPVHDAEGKDTSPKNVDVLNLGKPPQTGFLVLDVSEKAFNLGRSTRDEIKPDPLRMKRTGLQKQGSRVIFGVPKPGKKRKFMDVSKHYVSEPACKTRQQNEPAKSTKAIMPQSSGSQSWRNTSKIDPRERQATVSKAKIFKPTSKPTAATKNIAQKEESQNISSGNAADQKAEQKGTVSGISMDIQSGESTEEQTAILSRDTSGIPSSRKTSSSLKAERINKGKSAPAAGKLAKTEENKVLGENSSKMSDTVEPRRSNRRIQPTYRLLEGLQSSMVTSKIPTVSHGKGPQYESKSSSRGE